MTRTRILLVTLPIALGGLGLTAHATMRVRELEQELRAVTTEGKEAGESFVATLKGEHAERQRVAFDRRRDLALKLAAARRNRLLGFLGVAAAGLAGAALSVMSRIAAEVEEDRRHVGS
jgi:predicted phage gp36 major capsid-like protein